MALRTRTYISLIAFIATTVPYASMATVYHCEAEQSLSWKNGAWEPDYVPVEPKDRRIVRYDFDDSSGELVIGTTPNMPQTLSTLRVFHKLNDHYNLEAASVMVIKDNHVSFKYFTMHKRGKGISRLESSKVGQLLFGYMTNRQLANGQCKAGSADEWLPESDPSPDELLIPQPMHSHH